MENCFLDSLIFLAESSNFFLLLVEFDQTSYREKFPRNAGLDSIGYYYLPSKCKIQGRLEIEKCKLLVFLHGCIGGREYVGQKVIREAGFLEELEARNIGIF